MRPSADSNTGLSRRRDADVGADLRLGDVGLSRVLGSLTATELALAVTSTDISGGAGTVVMVVTVGSVTTWLSSVFEPPVVTNTTTANIASTAPPAPAPVTRRWRRRSEWPRRSTAS